MLIETSIRNPEYTDSLRRHYISSEDSAVIATSIKAQSAIALFYDSIGNTKKAQATLSDGIRRSHLDDRFDSVRYSYNRLSPEQKIEVVSQVAEFIELNLRLPNGTIPKEAGVLTEGVVTYLNGLSELGSTPQEVYVKGCTVECIEHFLDQAS